jgi:hypothetical protein
VIPRWHISQCQTYVKVTRSQSVRFRKEGYYSLGQSDGPCEYSKEYSGAINTGNFSTSCGPASFSKEIFLRVVTSAVICTF